MFLRSSDSFICALSFREIEKRGKLKIFFGGKTIYDERTSNNNVHSTIQINLNVVRENG
ncbi:hypothetical protein MTR_3g013750 [Medicago truncatula]|uniref:Uncharacterized protein n=1 Tax=Medicago truncatula TaxID=3880 RepID=G7IYN1_MEDTR|nr:hypothetical protein MTR_3g013750 [Medicago truncatula]